MGVAAATAATASAAAIQPEQIASAPGQTPPMGHNPGVSAPAPRYDGPPGRRGDDTKKVSRTQLGPYMSCVCD